MDDFNLIGVYINAMARGKPGTGPKNAMYSGSVKRSFESRFKRYKSVVLGVSQPSLDHERELHGEYL